MREVYMPQQVDIWQWWNEYYDSSRGHVISVFVSKKATVIQRYRRTQIQNVPVADKLDSRQQDLWLVLTGVR